MSESSTETCAACDEPTAWHRFGADFANGNGVTTVVSAVRLDDGKFQICHVDHVQEQINRVLLGASIPPSGGASIVLALAHEHLRRAWARADFEHQWERMSVPILADAAVVAPLAKYVSSYWRRRFEWRRMRANRRERGR